MIYVDIRKKTGDFHLDIKFQAENEVVALLGASGCGKSMTLKCIAGIETPDSGIIRLNDKVLFDSEKKIKLLPRERNVGLLFQDLALFPHMTVKQNIELVKDKNFEYTTEELLEKLYLKDKMDLYPNQLSGGQKQRVAIARMLATKPEIIMLDEPFSALDSFLKWQLEKELLDIFESFKKTVIYVSHDRNEAYRLTEKIVILEEGQIVEQGSTKEVFAKPMSMAGATITGCKNFSKLERVNEKEFFAKDWGVKISFATPVLGDYKYAGFRAHYFEPVENNDETNVVECDIIRVIEDTFSVIVTFRNKGNSSDKDFCEMRYEVSKKDWELIKNRERLYLKINPQKLIMLER